MKGSTSQVPSVLGYERHAKAFRTEKAPAAAANSPGGASSIAAPAPGLGFDGIGDGVYGYAVTSAPPDTNGAVGLNHYVEIVNQAFAVFDKSGNLKYGPVNTNTIWSGFGGGCETNNDGDGTVAYDKRAGRFVIQQFSVTTTPYLECVAVSTTGDPTGSYHRYSFGGFGSEFPDYPKLSVWPDGYYITFNMFNSGGTTFLGPKFCALERSKMLTGAAANVQCFEIANPTYGGDLASDMEGSIDPPSGSPNYIMGFEANKLDLWKFRVDWATPASTTLIGPSTMPVNSFSMACGNGGTCIPQLGTRQQLDSLGDRLMSRLSYRNFGSYESILATHSVGTPTGVRWYEIRNPGGSPPTVYQQSTYAPDSTYRWMPSIAQDRNGDIAMEYSVSSSSINPSISYTGRLASDPLSTMQTETNLFSGSGSQTRFLSRWGDYSSITVDPVDDCTFWVANEYIPAYGTFNWHTRIGNFKFASCVTPAWSAIYDVSNTPTSWVATQTQTYSVTLNNGGSQTWPAGGSNPVHLGVHFAASGGGGSINYSSWSTDQRFALPADLAPGASSTLSITVTAPAKSGNLVLEYQMVKEYQFWFDQYADVNVTVAPSWSAGYSVGTTPTSWSSSQSQIYSVVVTNNGTQTWPAGGSNPVHLGIHFAASGGGINANYNSWYTDQRFALPADLVPGTSVTLSIAVTAPAKTGNLVLEYQMVKEGQFWFDQYADVNVTVAPSWAATYSVGSTPTSWSRSQSQTYSVVLTNNGTQTWPAGGSNPVHLGVHFAATGGGGSVNYNSWYTDQRIALPADLAPGASATLGITVTAPGTSGNLVLEYQMVKEYQFWFEQYLDVNVKVS
jgi:hypothetical protein